MVVDRSGSLGGIKRHDFGPFGEVLGAGVGIRSAALGYGADSTRQKFTGKERDDETGLDYFGERYYSSVQGRFISVDPLMASAKASNPQTWNRFAYVLNNPLRYIDPDGMQTTSPWLQLTDEERKILTPKLQLQEKTLPNGKKRTETPQEAFERVIGPGSDKEIAERVVAVSNAIDIAGGHSNSAIWQQIKSLDGLYGDKGITVVFTVSKTGKDFLDTLGNNNYLVDGAIENARLFEPLAHGQLAIGEKHKHSARFKTTYATELSPHWTQENGYPDTRFDLHVDPQSSTCEKCTYRERVRAGQAHSNPYSPTETREKLKQQGIVPRQ
jgi:RHS repeat-associated protein